MTNKIISLLDGTDKKGVPKSKPGYELERKRRKGAGVALNGTGIQWFATPHFLVGSAPQPGVMAKLDLRELRLYLAILAETGMTGELQVELGNEYLYRLLKLDDSSLPKARKGLEHHHLITSKRTGKKARAYSITNPHDGTGLKAGRKWVTAVRSSDEDDGDWNPGWRD